jgi:hypothetical protein
MKLFLFEYTDQYCYGGAAVVAKDLEQARAMLFKRIHNPAWNAFNDMEQMHCIEAFGLCNEPMARIAWVNYECC